MRGAVLIFLIIFLVGFASASYTCPDNTTIKQDTVDIGVGKIKTANGLHLGLSLADETSVFNRMDAEVLIDAQSVELTNGTTSYAVFTDGTNQSVILVNNTNDTAAITVAGSTKTISEESRDSLGSFEVFLISTDEGGDVKIIIGRSRVELSNKDNPNEMITYNSKKYVLEIFSASDDNALIKVYKCSNDSLTITETVDVVNNTQQTNSSNQTSNQTTNQANNQTGPSPNSTINDTSTVNNTDSPAANNSDLNEEVGEPMMNRILKYIIIGGIALIALIFIVVLIRTIRNKES